MLEPRRRSLIVSGNVYFCDFCRTPRNPGGALRGICTPKDVRMTAETLQGACGDLIAGAPVMVRRAELNAADLVSIASMIDELAFQARIIALDGSAGGRVVSPDELQRMLLDAAAVTAELQSCMSDAVNAIETLRERLRCEAARALLIGDSVTRLVDGAGLNEAPL